MVKKTTWAIWVSQMGKKFWSSQMFNSLVCWWRELLNGNSCQWADSRPNPHCSWATDGLIHIHNDLSSEGISIHWHGMFSLFSQRLGLSKFSSHSPAWTYLSHWLSRIQLDHWVSKNRMWQYSSVWSTSNSPRIPCDQTRVWSKVQGLSLCGTQIASLVPRLSDLFLT